MSKSKQPPNTPLSDDTPEYTPEWLLNLLTKYGETEGILDGVLPQRLRSPESSSPAFSNATTDISGVLDKLSKTLTPPEGERTPTSVDWGDAAPADSTPSPSSAMDDLLASLRASGAEVTDETPAISPSEIETPEWLDDMAETTDEALPAVPVFPESAESDADWLAEPPTDAPEAEAGEEVPEWLMDFAGAEIPEANEPDVLSEPSPLPQIAETDTPPTPASDDDFSWLDEMVESDTSVQSSAPTPETPAEQESLEWDADWLEKIAAAYPIDPGAFADETTPETTLSEPEPVDPDEFVSDLPQITPSASSSIEIPAEPEMDEIEPETVLTEPDESDWLDALRQEVTDIPRAEESPAEAEAESTSEDVPDWLNELPETAESEPDVPDWLGALRESDADVSLSEEITPEETEEPLFADAPVLAEESPAEAETTADVPDWMHDLPAESETLTVGAEELPDWVPDGSETETEELFATEESPAVDVPDWMQSLDLDAPDDFSLDDVIEEIEPTALSAEADELLFESETDLTETTESDEASSLLEELTALAESDTEVAANVEPMEVLEKTETLPSALKTPEPTEDIETAHQFFGISAPTMDVAATVPPSKPPSMAARLVGALLSLLLIAIIAVPLFSHFNQGGYPFPWLKPSSASEEAVRAEVQTVVGSQLPNAVALVSFDYTPATEGEMNPLANAVIKQFLGQGMRVIAVSLNPEGQGMATAVLNDITDEKYSDKIVNAGYLPGGPVAVRNLMAEGAIGSLREISTGKTLASLPEWSAVQSLNGVGLVVTISDSADTARWWVEQTNLADGSPSFARMAVVSAAVEPFVRPYRDSNQFHALVAGINGAAALESARPQKTLGPASAMLDSQSVAHLVVMILMLLGTIAGLFVKYGQESE